MSTETAAARLQPAPVAWDDSLTGRVLTTLFAAWEQASVRYVVLRNYTRFPAHFGKDVDLVVHPEDRERSHAVMRQVATELSLHMTARVKRSSHVTYYLLPAPVDGTERGVLIDVRTDLVHRGLSYLPGALVIDSRQRHDRFYVPSPALESLGILLHCIIDAGHVRPSYARRLWEICVGDREEFVRAATAVVGGPLAQRLADTVESGAPEAALLLRGALLRTRARRDPRGVVRWVATRAGAVTDRVRGWIRPRGHIVVLVGPDGSGKTTLSQLVCRRFDVTRIPVSTVYLGAQKPLLPTRRLSQRLHRRFGNRPVVKPVKDVNRHQRLRGLVHIMADKWLRYIVHIRPALARGEVVVLDRYFYDLRTFHHPLIRTPWFESLMMRLIPAPAVMFCLQADPAVIAARKNELTTAETARQIELFRGLRRWVENFHEVSADGDLVANVDGITEHVLRLYTQHRCPASI